MKMIIPITGAQVPDEVFNISINNILYTFRVQYVSRNPEEFQYWVLSMYQNENALFEAFKLVQGVYIGALYNLNIGGALYIQSTSGNLADPTLDDLGFDQQLIFDDGVI